MQGISTQPRQHVSFARLSEIAPYEIIAHMSDVRIAQHMPLLSGKWDEWDFGLVLKPSSFGLGQRVTKMALDFTRQDARIDFVTVLLPPSRTKLGALARLGAIFVHEVNYEGSTFLKYRLETKRDR